MKIIHSFINQTTAVNWREHSLNLKPCWQCLAVILLILLLPASSRAANGAWTNKSGGTWSTPPNWVGGGVADGVDGTADFSTLNLTNDVTVMLDGSRTIGTLLFDDQNSTKHNWTLTPGSGGTLTLAVSSGSPAISIGSATTAISAVVAGTSGLTKNGAGTLTLSGNNTFTGDVIINTGPLWIQQNNALGTGSKTVTCNNGSIGHCQLHLDGTGGNLTLPSTINYLVSNWADPGTVYNEGGSNVINGNFTVTSGGGGLVFLANAGSLTLNGTISANTSGRGVVFDGVGNSVADGAISDGAGSLFLLMQGAGTATLNATNTYTGTTEVRHGTLLVNGSLATNVVTVDTNATLGGTGIIGGPVTVQAGATLSPGIGIPWPPHTLTVSNTLALVAGSTTLMQLNKSAGTNDQVRGITALTYSGTLAVTNLAGTLAAGDSFKLFDATNYVGNFATISPVTPGIGITWDMTYLPVDGSLRIAGASGGQSNQTVALQTGYSFVSCQVVGSANNDVNNTNFLQVPPTFSDPNGVNNAVLLVWNCSGLNSYQYFTDEDAGGSGTGWYDATGNLASNVIWNPGRGMIIDNRSGASATLTLVGTPAVPSLPPTNFCGSPGVSLLGRQTNDVGTYENVLGLNPQTGAQVLRHVAGQPILPLAAPNYTVFTFTNGAWTPGVPTLTNNEAAFFSVPFGSFAVGDKYKANNTNWLNSATSWTNNAMPGMVDFAVWNSIVSAPNTTNTLGADMTLGGIKIINPGGPVTLTSGNTLTLNGAGGIGIDMSSASQNLTIHCPVTVASNQTWAVASSRRLTVDSLLVNAPFQIGGFGRTYINTMVGAGIYPVDFQGSSHTEIGSLSGNSPLQVDGPATLSLTGNDTSTGPVTLNDGATLQLLADSNTTFGNGTVVNATNATVTILADALTPGNTGQIISFGSGGLNLGNVTLNVPGTNAILSVGVVTMLDGPIAFAGPGTTHIHGINKDGIFPVDFQGSSYGSPSEIEWSFQDNSRSDGCGPITDISELNKGGTNKTLVLWGTNSYAGPTTISGGALVLAGDNSVVTNKTMVSGPATLVLVANPGNTHGGVCAALGSTELDLTDGATVQLIADSNTAFASATTVAATNATVTLSAGALTPGQTNRTLTFAGGGLNLSNATINVPDSGDILALGPIACSGPLQIGGFGRTDVSGVHGDGIYPVDFQGSSYGSPSEYEWAPGDSCTCGAIDTTGGLNKLGNDVLVLTGINTYTGATVISNGALVVSGSLLGGGPVTVAGGTLHGSGVIMSPVTVQAAACLCPDGLVVGNIGSSGQDGVIMTVSNNLSLAGTAWFGINRTNIHNSDRVSGISTVTYGGTLMVTNRGPALQAGDTFTLFSAGSFFDVFMEVSLPPLNPGLVWNTSQLAVNGSISVVAVSPACISVQMGTGGGCCLNWPANQGWILQQTTNLLGGWNDLVTTTNSYEVVPTGPGQFYRLRSGP